MSEAQQLYQLQALDLEIEDLNRSIASIDERLCETEELVLARQNLTDLQDQVRKQEKTIRELDSEVNDIAAKIKGFETKLYDGTVKNSKELGSMEKEVALLKDKKSRLEDQILELMDAVESGASSIEAAKQTLLAVQLEWDRAQAGLREERSQLTSRLDQRCEARKALEKTIRPESLHLYEELRATKRGRAVAKVEQNTCQGCRITLPTNVVQLARVSPKLVFCSSCGRILLAGR